ncbi:hypothetical protein CYLTODRAFT_393808 [Cylindrobasidium torrendii FP15055 ss-10]|uniref:Uncharacterized protein n=1 Tax=Cylindrobasidium torrendii FP15055 ss-10 TaxID=1314674 RepID=A0A0D7BFT7_9AGAR|nr:hypothetical protein CYLTODRAFT_393808 [Cylindrobasidium torrendii FP15055 ss-10]
MEKPDRSEIIDITYGQLHEYLSGRLEGTSPTKVEAILAPRVKQLQSFQHPFGTPSTASRQKIQSGSVTLEDGVVFSIEETNKEFIFAISAAFKIDEVHAFILLRSFMYNQGFPALDDSKLPLAEACVEAITPFYLSERLSVLRVLVPLFRAREDENDPAHKVSQLFLPKVLSDGPKFVQQILAEYTRKSREGFDKPLAQNAKQAYEWAKQNLKEQLCLLELLFWTMWGAVRCTGPLVEAILTTAFSTNLGNDYADSPIFFGAEAQVIEQDLAVMWNLITVEILELENLSDPDVTIINAVPSTTDDWYFTDPKSLERIHQLILKYDSSQFVCTHLAWTYTLTRVTTAATKLTSPQSQPGSPIILPPAWLPFIQALGGNRPIHAAILESCLRVDNHLFQMLHHMLTASPFFVTMLAFKADSSVTDTNVIAFRSVLKGLIVALLDMTSPESIPDAEGFMDVWIALFGRSEVHAVAKICRQYWEIDWHFWANRRAIFDVARSRFPIQVKPLLRLARAMTGAGFLDTDPLCASDDTNPSTDSSEDQQACGAFVFDFIDTLPSYSFVVPSASTFGSQALYEKVLDRSSAVGHTYRNVHPIILPGGSILPEHSIGRALTAEGGEFLAICWNHEHSGWKLMLDVLAEYVNQRSLYPSTKAPEIPVAHVLLTLEGAGVETEGGVDEGLVTDILNLIRSVVLDNPSQAAQLFGSMEADSTSAQPGIVQLTMGILDHAFASISPRSNKAAIPTSLISSALSVLSAVLTIPDKSIRVWIYLKSTTILFGTGRAPGTAASALQVERASGRYTVTLSMLHLVQQLFDDAMVISGTDDPQQKALKGDVLLSALRFIHSEIWVEHIGWRYANVGDRFDIGRRISSVFVKVLQNTPEDVGRAPFPALSAVVVDLLLLKASSSTVNPLVTSVAAGRTMLQTLSGARRQADVRKAVLLLQSKLHLTRLLLDRKGGIPESAGKLCLLEQVLSNQTVHSGVADASKARADPIDTLASYIIQRDVGSIAPLEAVRIITAMCRSLSALSPIPAIASHFGDAEAKTAEFSRHLGDPYEDMSLRFALWNFIAVAMDTEAALAEIFVSGQLQNDRKGRVRELEAPGTPRPKTVMAIARKALYETWDALWEANPQLLCAILRFLDVTWQHSVEHKWAIEELRKDTVLWSRLAQVASKDVGPVPDSKDISDDIVNIDGIRRSKMHDAVATFSYRLACKGHALHIIGLDIGQTYKKDSPSTKSESFKAVESHFRGEDELMELLGEAVVSSYQPELYDELVEFLQENVPSLSIEQLQVQDPLTEREYGDRFSLSPAFLHARLRPLQPDLNAMSVDLDLVECVERLLYAFNLNQSLTHSQLFLTDSARFILQEIAPHFRGDLSVRPNFITVAKALSSTLANERRLGDMVSTVHSKRLAVLQGVLEVAWFGVIDKEDQLKSFIDIIANVRAIIVNSAQRPIASLMGTCSTPFHRSLLQVLFWCMKNARSTLQLSKNVKSKHRQTVTEAVDATMTFVVDALHIVFSGAMTTLDQDLDRDMELLIAVFEQASRRDITPSSAKWLTACEDANIIEESLILWTRMDLVGLSDVSLLVNRRTPLYVRHVLLFHMSLASLPTPAERLASKGVVAAYSNNLISTAVSNGLIDITIPELSGHRSPAHYAYCTMLSVVSNVTAAIGRENHYFGVDICGMISLFGGQISRITAWSIGDPVSLELLEELELVVQLFFSLSESGPSTSHRDPAVDKKLRLFAPYALNLLQQVNHAITHPQQLASQFIAVTEEEQQLVDSKPANGDPLKRPLVVHLLHRFYRLSSDLIFTLLNTSRGYTVLLGDEDDWPLTEVILSPHSKVILEDPASIGTLMELGNSTIDLLSELVNLPAGQALITPGPLLSSKFAVGLNVKNAITVARRNIEAILVYASTQLAMSTLKPEVEASNEMDTDDLDVSMTAKSDGVLDRRAPRASVSMVASERLRRMTSDLGHELRDMNIRAGEQIKKSENVVKSGGVDLTSILAAFIKERIPSDS